MLLLLKDTTAGSSSRAFSRMPAEDESLEDLFDEQEDSFLQACLSPPHLTSTPTRQISAGSSPCSDLDLLEVLEGTFLNRSSIEPSLSLISHQTSSDNPAPMQLDEASSIPVLQPITFTSAGPSTWAGFKIVGDNIDKNVQPRFMRIDSRTRSLHYFHCYAVQDRVDSSSFSDSLPQPATFPASEIYRHVIPSTEDYEILNHNLAVHVSRILFSHMSFFHDKFKGAAIKHILHSHSAEMAKKSAIVSGNNCLL